MPEEASVRDPLIELWLIGQERVRLESRLARERLGAERAAAHGQRSPRRVVGRALVRAGMWLIVAGGASTPAAARNAGR
jgi:hypothetical protein